jgi:hypothetical protein
MCLKGSKLKACNNLEKASEKHIDPISSLNSFDDDFTMIKNTSNIGIFSLLIYFRCLNFKMLSDNTHVLPISSSKLSLL